MSNSRFGSEQNLLQEIETNSRAQAPASSQSPLPQNSIVTHSTTKQGLPTWASSLLISLGLSIVLTGILWAVFYGISRSKTKKNVSQLQQQLLQPLETNSTVAPAVIAP